MRKISSVNGWISKRVFPVIWFGFLIVIGGGMLTQMKSFIDALFPLVIMTFMAGMGYLVMKLLVFDLCDEAWDAGTHLVFRNGRTRVDVDFTNIKNVSYSMSNPPRVTLRLRQECALGDRIVFSPTLDGKFFSFKEPRVVEEIIERVDLARFPSTKAP